MDSESSDEVEEDGSELESANEEVNKMSFVLYARIWIHMNGLDRDPLGLVFIYILCEQVSRPAYGYNYGFCYVEERFAPSFGPFSKLNVKGIVDPKLLIRIRIRLLRKFLIRFQHQHKFSS